MNNGESVKKYNDLLIQYLNDLVKSIDNNEINYRIFEEAASRLKNQLVEYNLDISEDGVKTLMSNAFKEYSNILKKHFDNSNIHRIDINTINSENLSSEMSAVTNNLANAVINMNKIAEYYDLLNRIKGTLTVFFQQNYSSYNELKFEVEQILNDVINNTFSTYTTKKIDEFTRDTLPVLYTIGDSIVYEESVKEEVGFSVCNNDERDAFISETMDLEIHEGFENGVVTLSVTDSMGKTVMHYGKDAMEILTSYNQLFESSRPGKKADTSNWELDTSAKNTNEIDKFVNNNINSNTDNQVNNDENKNDTDNENLIKNFLANQNNNSDNKVSNSLVDDLNIINNNEINNMELGNLTYNDNIINNNLEENNVTTNDLYNSSSDNFDYSESNTDKSNVDFDNLVNSITNNNFSNINGNENNVDLNNMNYDNSNEVVDDNIQKVRNSIGLNEDSYSTGFSFLPDYNNPNEDRDAFIKKATGIQIEEDIDNKGLLYLKVIEPTGRQQIYTGKEAVRMIKNFNKTYLDANPDKTVDTSLIDNCKE